MIHWDWVWTILIITTVFSTISAMYTSLTEPAKAERMKAEAALIEIKMRTKERA